MTGSQSPFASARPVDAAPCMLTGFECGERAAYNVASRFPWRLERNRRRAGIRVPHARLLASVISAASEPRLLPAASAPSRAYGAAALLSMQAGAFESDDQAGWVADDRERCRTGARHS